MNKFSLIYGWLGWLNFITSELNNSTIVGNTNCPGYELIQVKTTSTTLTGKLKLSGSPCNMYGKDIEELRLEVSYEFTSLRVTVDDWNEPNYRVPDNLLFPDLPYENYQNKLKFKYHKSPFSFSVQRVDDDEIIFDTKHHPLIFQDQFIQLRSKLPKDANIYGIGEVVGSFRRDPDDTIQAMWARDAGSPINENVYGSHPLYVELRNQLVHGVHLLNSYGMDVILSNQSVTYNVLGGVLDLSFFAGPTIDRLMDQYTGTFGRPHMIPYWSLGFHHCRYGFKSIKEIEEVVQQYSLHGIPLETMWTDIDYMNMFRDFTVDPINFPLTKLQSFITKLHENHQRYVLIVDPAISRNETYETYLDGKTKDVFIKNPDGSDYVGQVWPGFSLFPDWLAPNTQTWWTDHLSKFMKELPVDGIWIDMNEPSSFCTGSCGSNRTGIPNLPWKDPHYNLNLPQTFKEPNYAIHNHHGNLSLKTVSTDAIHYGGITEFQIHNLYGHMEAVATRNALESIQPDNRPFILSRSTFTGSGAVTAHWLGDNYSSWDQMKQSISGILSSQLFGIPFVGSDICGFGGDTTEELCLRWMQLGALYPFSRNHNAIDQVLQEPYLWSSVTHASKLALHTRYSLLPYLYTLMQRTHERGTPVWNALAFTFPDQSHYITIDTQFLIGKSILASPVLTPNKTEVEAQIPPGYWFDFHDFHPIRGPTTVTLPAPLDGHLPLHLRAGTILPLQTPPPLHSSSSPPLTLHDCRQLPYQLIIAFDPLTSLATGTLYLDDGLTPTSRYRYTQLQLNASLTSLSVTGHFGYHPKSPFYLDKITLLGFPTTLQASSKTSTISNLTLVTPLVTKSLLETAKVSHHRQAPLITTDTVHHHHRQAHLTTNTPDSNGELTRWDLTNLKIDLHLPFDLYYEF